MSASDRMVITKLLINRVLPELECLASSDDSLRDAQSLAVRLALGLLSFDADMDDESDDTFVDPKQSEVKEIVLDWLNGKSTIWRDATQRELKDFVSSHVLEYYFMIYFVLRLWGPNGLS